MIILYIAAVGIYFLFAICFAVLFAFQIIAAFTTDAPFVSVPQHVEDTIVQNLHLTDSSVLYDLGCGDARVLVCAVKSHPNIRAIGVEKALIPYFIAKFKTRNYSNITIRREDIFTTSISDATHIFVYLYPNVISSLFPHIQKACKHGTMFMSCDFELTDLISPVQPESAIVLDTTMKRGKKILIYRV